MNNIDNGRFALNSGGHRRLPRAGSLSLVVRAESHALGDMKTKNLMLLRCTSIIFAIVVAWVVLALLITFGDPSWRVRPVTRPISAAPQPPPPSFIYTQFVAGGPLTVATQARNGSLVVVTQYELPTIHLPTRYYVVEADGASREVSSSEFSGVRQSLDLIDFRYQPDLKLDDLK